MSLSFFGSKEISSDRLKRFVNEELLPTNKLGLGNAATVVPWEELKKTLRPGESLGARQVASIVRELARCGHGDALADKILERLEANQNWHAQEVDLPALRRAVSEARKLQELRMPAVYTKDLRHLTERLGLAVPASDPTKWKVSHQEALRILTAQISEKYGARVATLLKRHSLDDALIRQKPLKCWNPKRLESNLQLAVAQATQDGKDPLKATQDAKDPLIDQTTTNRVNKFLSQLVLNPQSPNGLIGHLTSRHREKAWVNRILEGYYQLKSVALEELSAALKARLAQGSDTYRQELRETLKLLQEKCPEAMQWPVTRALQQALGRYGSSFELRRVFIRHLNLTSDGATQGEKLINLRQVLAIATDELYPDKEINAEAAQFAKKVLQSVETASELEDYLEAIKPVRISIEGWFAARVESFQALIDDRRTLVDRCGAHTEAIRLNPNDANAYDHRAFAKNELGRYQEAIDDCSEAIRLNPECANAYNNRAFAKNRLRRHQEAIDDYSEAIRLNPECANAYHNRAFAKNELGRYQEAIDDCSDAIRLNPKFASAYNNRAFAKHELGRYQEAIDDCSQAVRLNPKDANANHNRAFAKNKLGRYQEAIDDCSEAIRLNPKLANAYDHRAFAKNKLGRYQEAIDDCSEAIRLNPEFANAYNNRAFAKNELGRSQEAIDDYSEAIRLNPKRANAYNNRSINHISSGSPD